MWAAWGPPMPSSAAGECSGQGVDEGGSGAGGRPGCQWAGGCRVGAATTVHPVDTPTLPAHHPRGNLGGGLTQIAMPAVFDMLVHSYGYKPNHAWRLAFYLPGCLHIFGGLLCFIFGQDHPDGRTAEVKATSGVSLKDDMVSEGWGVWVDWSGSGSAGAGARARAPLHPHPPPTAHCQPANPPPRLPAHPPTRPPAHLPTRPPAHPPTRPPATILSGLARLAGRHPELPYLRADGGVRRNVWRRDRGGQRVVQILPGALEWRAQRGDGEGFGEGRRPLVTAPGPLPCPAACAAPRPRASPTRPPTPPPHPPQTPNLPAEPLQHQPDPGRRHSLHLRPAQPGVPPVGRRGVRPCVRPLWAPRAHHVALCRRLWRRPFHAALRRPAHLPGCRHRAHDHLLLPVRARCEGVHGV